MDTEKSKFTGFLKSSIENDTFIRLKFGKYKGGDRDFENVFVSKIRVNEGDRLSFKFRYKTKDVVKNYELDKGINLADEILGKDFFSAALFTSEKDYMLDYSKKRKPQLHIKKPSLIQKETQLHNRIKSRFVSHEAVYLKYLGISTSDGKIKADKYDKYRQVDKFIEILDSLVRKSNLKDKKKLTVTDMGSGKSYLTFAVYEYLQNKLGYDVEITGIEEKEELVKISNAAAKRSGFDGLKFINGKIGVPENKNTDIVIALHACDTATDDAIKSAVESKAEIIILAPCCQKYLRKKFTVPQDLKSIFKHGIHEERLAVMLTDGLRALTLESMGYETKVFEFVSTEHTSRNTMITAVKKDIGNDNMTEEVNKIKKMFSLEDIYLDKILPD